MRLGWRIPLPGPFYLAGTIWRSRKRPQPYWYGYLPDGSRCPHRHRREDTAEECTRKMARRYEHPNGCCCQHCPHGGNCR